VGLAEEIYLVDFGKIGNANVELQVLNESLNDLAITNDTIYLFEILVTK